MAQDQGVKVSDVHGKLWVLGVLQRLPVRGATAVFAANHSQSFVTLDVFLGVFWMTNYCDGSHFVVGPQNAQTPANGAIAVGDLLRRVRNFDADGAAVAGG